MGSAAPLGGEAGGPGVIRPGQVPRRSKWLGSTGRRQQAKAAGRSVEGGMARIREAIEMLIKMRGREFTAMFEGLL